jgi:hypothetical protein
MSCLNFILELSLFTFPAPSGIPATKLFSFHMHARSQLPHLSAKKAHVPQRKEAFANAGIIQRGKGLFECINKDLYRSGKGLTNRIRSASKAESVCSVMTTKL